MKQQLEPLESLLSSASAREAGKWKSGAFAVIAVYLLFTGLWQLTKGNYGQKAWLNIFLGLCSAMVVRYEKRIYISELGLVKETHTWFSHHREILPWKEIRSVTLQTKGERVMLFAERDVTGWKLLFGKGDMPKLKELIKQYAPKLKITEVYPRF
ncbi:MAG: hypothetical protein IJM42_04270 [Synergistes sp.]|nr:hypothetical protein [Synergistes sp.]